MASARTVPGPPHVPSPPAKTTAGFGRRGRWPRLSCPTSGGARSCRPSCPSTRTLSASRSEQWGRRAIGGGAKGQQHCRGSALPQPLPTLYGLVGSQLAHRWSISSWSASDRHRTAASQQAPGQPGLARGGLARNAPPPAAQLNAAARPLFPPGSSIDDSTSDLHLGAYYTC